MKTVRHQAWHIQINFKSQTLIANGIESSRGNWAPLKLRLSSLVFNSKYQTEYKNFAITIM